MRGRVCMLQRERAYPQRDNADLKKTLDIPATIKEVRAAAVRWPLPARRAERLRAPQIVGADKEAAYLAQLDALAENAFDDQVRRWHAFFTVLQRLTRACRSLATQKCTGANPRCVAAALQHARHKSAPDVARPRRSYPLIKDLRGIFLSAWKAPILPLAELSHYTPAKHN